MPWWDNPLLQQPKAAATAGGIKYTPKALPFGTVQPKPPQPAWLQKAQAKAPAPQKPPKPPPPQPGGLTATLPFQAVQFGAQLAQQLPSYVQQIGALISGQPGFTGGGGPIAPLSPGLPAWLQAGQPGFTGGGGPLPPPLPTYAASQLFQPTPPLSAIGQAYQAQAQQVYGITPTYGPFGLTQAQLADAERQQALADYWSQFYNVTTSVPAAGYAPSFGAGAGYGYGGYGGFGGYGGGGGSKQPDAYGWLRDLILWNPRA